jgi:hypothetical protein
MLEWVLSAYVVLVRIAVHQRSVERAYALLEQLETLGCRQGLYFVTVGDHPAVVRDYCEARPLGLPCTFAMIACLFTGSTTMCASPARSYFARTLTF